MATGRIGSTPVLRVRWSDQPTAGTTVLSGLDDNSVALVYDAGYEAVYRNGVLLSRGNDYTATDGTTVTLIDATLDGDIIEIFANDLVPLTDAISKGQYNAKGALLSATAASTPAVLAVGTNGQFLSANSSTSTGLEWVAAPTSGANWSLLNAGGTALTGAQTVTVSGISGKDKIMVIVDAGSAADAQSIIGVRFNGDTASNYYTYGLQVNGSQTYSSSVSGRINVNTSYVRLGRLGLSEGQLLSGYCLITGCNASGVKVFNSAAGLTADGSYNQEGTAAGGYWNESSTVSSVSIFSSSGNLDAGTVFVYASA
jgi:hypothetical protein